ncbi:MAG: hypothetical protein NZ480_02645, partial [Bdellovibrionaceae bacterium]|nr:hypothetical protein [Pseudobdellovibrionaceae bacterium]
MMTLVDPRLGRARNVLTRFFVTVFVSLMVAACAVREDRSHVTIDFSSVISSEGYQSNEKMSGYASVVSIDQPQNLSMYLFVTLSRTDKDLIDGQPALHFERQLSDGVSSVVELEVPRGKYTLQILLIERKEQGFTNGVSDTVLLLKAYQQVVTIKLEKSVENLSIALQELTDFITARLAGRITYGQMRGNEYGPTGNITYRIKLRPDLPSIPLPVALTSYGSAINGWFRALGAYSSEIAGVEYVLNGVVPVGGLFPGRTYYRLDELSEWAAAPSLNKKVVSAWLPHRLIFKLSGSSIYSGVSDPIGVVLGFWGHNAHLKDARIVNLGEPLWVAEDIGLSGSMSGGVGQLRFGVSGGNWTFNSLTISDFSGGELVVSKRLSERYSNSLTLNRVAQAIRGITIGGSEGFGHDKLYMGTSVASGVGSGELFANQLVLTTQALKRDDVRYVFGGFSGAIRNPLDSLSSSTINYLGEKCMGATTPCLGQNYIRFRLLPGIDLGLPNSYVRVFYKQNSPGAL